ncbi:MAG: RelA/SpoT family protein [Prevotella sp.]|nr:RelA/SpoT family protein [Prevotella sp.]MCM1075506.1 RelA/SpoT family protein [Ruminococcus sp.]
MSPREDADNKMIESAYAEVLDLYLRSHHRKKVELIDRAFKFAREAHKGVRRRSGEPYIMHPIAVARIVIGELGLGSTSICAALLHDVVEDTDYTHEDIEAAFGTKIASIVEGLTKISGGILGTNASLQAENFRKLLLSMSTDVRVVLIKMADRLHNMRTLQALRHEKQLKIAGETLYVYAPLAHRLGLFKMKEEFEDLAFRFEHPKKYKEIMSLVDNSAAHRDAIVEEFVAPVRRKLDEAGFKYTIKARVKSAYSIYRKMEAKKVSFSDIYDIYAVRVVFDNEDDALEAIRCWQIYTFFTEGNKVHPDRLRDWITTPKANGYRALHLTVMGPDGKWIEVQIRSAKMDRIAELGYAAHWKYKNVDYEEDSELSLWMNTIKDILANPEPDAIDFLDTIKLNLFSSEIYVFTPKGDLITLPKGSTVLDMAFAIHSQLGLHCIAGKISHRLVSLSHELHSGDQVEIITSESQTPRAEWLDYCNTAKARHALRTVLRHDTAALAEHGRELFAKLLAEQGRKSSPDILSRVLAYYHLESEEEFYIMLASDGIDVPGKALKGKGKSRFSLLTKLLRNPFSSRRSSSSADAPATQKIDRRAIYMLHPEQNPPNFRIEECCSPLPGDDVLGFVDDDETVVLHKVDCLRAQRLKSQYGSRLVDTRWHGEGVRFEASVKVDGIDRQGILEDVVHCVVTADNTDLKAMNIDTADSVFHCRLSVNVDNVSTVETLCSNLLKIKGVKFAKRIS